MGIDLFMDGAPRGVEPILYIGYRMYNIIRKCVCFSTGRLRPVVDHSYEDWIYTSKFESDENSPFVRSLRAWMIVGDCDGMIRSRDMDAISTAILEWLDDAKAYVKHRTPPAVATPAYIEDMFDGVVPAVAQRYLTNSQGLGAFFTTAAEHGCNVYIE